MDHWLGYRISVDRAAPVSDEDESREYWDEPQHPHKAVLRKGPRSNLIAVIAEHLRPWDLSKWQGEGHLFPTVRRLLLDKGLTFEDAENEATDLIRLAFISLGRGTETRPSWNEGQRHHTTSMYSCNFCAGELDEQQISRKHRFCSRDCAEKAIRLRDYEQSYGNDPLGQAAHHIARQATFAPKVCPHCSKTFRPATKNTEYCSSECGNAARAYVKPRPCLQCGEDFKPHGDDGKLCSEKCAKAYQARRKPELGTRYCAECGHEFYPRNNQALFCSPKCNGRAKDARKKAIRQATALERELGRAGLL